MAQAHPPFPQSCCWRECRLGSVGSWGCICKTGAHHVCPALSGADATPPPCRAPGCSYTPVTALSAVSATLPHKRPCRTPCRKGVAGTLDLPKPVALQGSVAAMRARVTLQTFFAYNGKVRLIRAFRDCKQRSLTVSKKAPTVSKKASPFWRKFKGQHD